MISLPTEKKIAWSTAVQYLGKIAQLALGVLTLKMITNYLGPEEYGLYAKMAELSLFFFTIGNLGIFGNTVRKMSENPLSGHTFVNALFARIFTGIPIFALPIIFFPKFGVAFFAASLFFDYVTSVCDAALQANYLMGRATLALLFGRAVNLAGVLALISYGAPNQADIFFLAPVVATAATAAASLYFVRRRFAFRFTFDFPLMKEILFSSVPFGLINIINNLYYRFLPSYLVAKILSNAQFASYNVSLHISSYAALLSTFLMFSVLPEFKSALKNKPEKARELFNLSKKTLALMALAMLIFGTLFAPTAIKLLTGKEYFIPELSFVLPMMLVLAAISYFYDLLLISLFAMEKELWFLKREIAALAIASAIFLAAARTTDPLLGVFLILLGAISGELCMVIMAGKKLKDKGKCWNTRKQGASEAAVRNVQR